MICRTCGDYTRGDEVCGACGTMQPISRLPAKRVAGAPVPWQEAARPLARGVALVAAGFLAEWLLRSAARYVAELPSGGKSRLPAKMKSGRPTNDLLPKGTVAMSETVIMRRTIVRR